MVREKAGYAFPSSQQDHQNFCRVEFFCALFYERFSLIHFYLLVCSLQIPHLFHDRSYSYAVLFRSHVQCFYDILFYLIVRDLFRKISSLPDAHRIYYSIRRLIHFSLEVGRTTNKNICEASLTFLYGNFCILLEKCYFITLHYIFITLCSDVFRGNKSSIRAMQSQKSPMNPSLLSAKPRISLASPAR